MNDETPRMFAVPAAGYDRLIGRYLLTLAPAFAPFTLGPHGAYLETLDDSGRAALRLACLNTFDRPEQPFTVEARAWFARGTV